MRRPRRVKVTVPASTSNLGPGFDCLGLALGLYNELVVEEHPEPGETTIEISGEGAETLPRGPENMILKAANAVIAGREHGRLLFKAVNRIPLARGLGSSAAAIVSGLVAANELFKPSALTPRELFQYAATLEGHPDNAAPALFGGLTVCVKQRQGSEPFPLKVHKDLCAVVCVPDFELATSKARAVLPHTVLLSQAVDNIARAALLTAALERGIWGALSEATQDVLHQPYRSSLVAGLDEALSAARRAAPCGAALSGSGPTTVAFCKKGPHARRIGEAMRSEFSRRGVKCKVLVLAVDRRGARAQ
ncbi:MAG: homoserine kinase [Elusimicrobia bacterium]|nr:homoserine kinase [Elusimicrobiota bacterium]